ncbi:hypothetical protein LTR36_005342 [Oleoguttula mirabilis]|uniref:AB hydrolase-1 domain-containing protein n=1 Tax=Oleoguttula mirabilis TaxID=1507867 RepID=A0AAV9JEH5_9PEZI|nr:hypothetical protein LTR36_005342 [Oleoguttula mirabilis]
MAIRPALAVVVPPPLMPDAQQWEHIRRPRSQPPAAHRDRDRDRDRASKRRSANHVKARPADPAVITSILDSLGTLTPPPRIHADDYYSEIGSFSSKSTRPYSSDGTVSSAPSFARSAGFGVEYGTGLSLLDETGTSDAALPPTIRTSRSPSGLSSFVVPSPNSFHGSGNWRLQPASIASRTSSLSSLSKEEESVARNKHSAQSWIKQTQKSFDQDSMTTERSRVSRKSLRPITSQETLRPPDIADFPVLLGAVDLESLSRVEQIIAKTPPPLANNKGRLYLDDTGVSEESIVVDSPISVAKTREAECTPHSSSLPTATDQTTLTPATPQRISPRKSPIVDSIPMRTSSLRHTSSSPAGGKKRERKTKRQTIASRSESEQSQKSQSIPEASWADLGEDDETVKRIRQLREQRKSRIEESKTFPDFAEIPPSDSEPNGTPVADLSARRSEDSKRGSRVRPLANRAATEPTSKAHRVLGITGEDPMPGLIGVLIPNHRLSGSVSPERSRRPQSRLGDKAAQFLHNRPGTASSPTPPLSLDYSYAQAVEALQGVEHEVQQRKLHSRGHSTASITSRAVDLPPLVTPESSPDTAAVRLRPKSARRKVVEPQNRWTSHHPDLPLASDKRNSRRKSMSDARRTRNVESTPEVQRRDSIEDAVLEYLYAPRLSQKVRHPLSGRIISFSEVGDPNGAAVFVCVGMGLTRYVTAFYDELATTLRLRLITVDRPGVGGSEAYPPHDRSGPLSWPEDVLAICQYIGIAKFSLLAHSAGAVYALATALILPHLVQGKVHLLAPWIPPSQLGAISHPTATAPPAGALPRSQRILRVLPASFLKAANSSFMTATSASLKPANKRQIDTAKAQQREQSLSPTRVPDRPSTSNRPDYHRRESMMQMDQLMPTIKPMENFPITVKEEEELEGERRRSSLFLSATATPTDPNFTFAANALNAAEHAENERKLEYTSRLTQCTWELATRDSNPATDLLVCLERHREIGFRYTDVSREVAITHGSDDKRVPLGNVKWLAEQMNSRALAGLNGELEGYSSPHSRDGWADKRYARGGCDVRVLEGEGHGLMASAPIMSDVLTEIAGYWTGQEKGRTKT